MDTNAVYETLTSRELTHEHKLMGLARRAENSLDALHIPERARCVCFRREKGAGQAETNYLSPPGR